MSEILNTFTKRCLNGEGVTFSFVLCNVTVVNLHLHLADTFIQSDLQMRTMEAIKINKRAMICKCYNKSQLA